MAIETHTPLHDPHRLHNDAQKESDRAALLWILLVVAAVAVIGYGFYNHWHESAYNGLPDNNPQTVTGAPATTPTPTPATPETTQP